MLGGDSEVTLRCLEIYAPGDALVERTNSMWILRFAAEAWQGWWVEKWKLGGGFTKKIQKGQIDDQGHSGVDKRT